MQHVSVSAPVPKQLYGVLLSKIPIARAALLGILRWPRRTWRTFRACNRKIHSGMPIRALIDRRIDGLWGFLLILPTLSTPMCFLSCWPSLYYFIDGIRFSFNAVKQSTWVIFLKHFYFHFIKLFLRWLYINCTLCCCRQALEQNVSHHYSACASRAAIMVLQ